MVACPPGTSACASPTDSGASGTSARLQCLEPALCSMQQGAAVTASLSTASTASAAAASSGQATSGQTTSGAAGAASTATGSLVLVSQQVAQAQAVDQGPKISLVGPSVVYLQQGDAYTRCNTSSGSASPCDRGAAAYDSVDGDLTQLVQMTCVGLAQLVPFASVGLLRCAGLGSSALPGTHTLQFRVVNSRGFSSSVSRTVVVSPAPDPGDCIDGELVMCFITGRVCWLHRVHRRHVL